MSRLPTRHALLPIELITLTRSCAATWTWYAAPRSRLALGPPRRLGAQRSFSAAPASQHKKQFFVTTPIYYVNADPHIGHLHSTLLADVLARYNTLRHSTHGNPCSSLLCTGTDEHGLKIQRVAEAQRIAPLELCDRVSQTFRDLANLAGIQPHTFIRTTQPRHRQAVEHLWRELKNKGYIYKSSYAGWYAVSDEAYYSENQVTDTVDPTTGDQIKTSIETGSRVEWMQEDNYKFRLSAFRKPLLEWLASEPNRTSIGHTSCPSLKNLQDLSISRPSSRLTWGIPVPDDPDHTIYVWIDALVNYMTVTGYPWTPAGAKMNLAWPPDRMVVGKDIIRFHALYLPAVLLALDLPLPKHLLAHGHWTMDKFKMSKSRGNVASPFTAIQKWGLDAMRCYLMKVGGNSAVDADYSDEAIEVFYKKSLKGQMGNLISRIGNKKMVQRAEEGGRKLWDVPKVVEEVDEEVRKALIELRDTFESHMNKFELHRALNALFDALTLANKHIQQLEPWAETSSSETVHRALFYSSETLRIIAILVRPVMPQKSKQLLDMLGVAEEKRGWEDAVLGQGGERTLDVLGRDQLFPGLTVKKPKGGDGRDIVSPLSTGLSNAVIL
ncbi:BZ3500_MvSof-1268-A1-R1_Chr4-3g07317 [Microbotryum saponariae]|uniref:Probable methionine--tRNA ligase, mitochondrial n=1 Tax=Microbotryum saponariae TaxID=289078 RepID=A0A2X0LNM4_9BASI|nr:BZ3500_MvSof-1268-A1-R1_Chr4-3g07317 [Microbotryum saponariae]SDA06980.1 BZ3501_MvSof-1269-A2-R1_Chr4-2g07026 [Microbotryum saponariae]